MSEFREFDHLISIAETDRAIELAEIHLPPETETDDRGRSKREVEFTYRADDVKHKTYIAQISNDDVNKLVATKTSTHDSGITGFVGYYLHTGRGEFTVRRKIIDTPEDNLGDTDHHELTDFELSFMTPQTNDWDNFIDLLTHPAGQSEATAQPGRFMRLFGWIKRDTQNH